MSKSGPKPTGDIKARGAARIAFRQANQALKRSDPEAFQAARSASMRANRPEGGWNNAPMVPRPQRPAPPVVHNPSPTPTGPGEYTHPIAGYGQGARY